MFKTGLPSGQPRSLRSIAEGKVDPKNVEQGTLEPLPKYVDIAHEACTALPTALPQVAPPSPFKLGGGK